MEAEQTKIDQKVKKHTTRLNVIFLITFLLFSILILRLGMLQIVEGEDKRIESEAIEEVTSSRESPRGRILDSRYREVVGNEPFFSLTYTKTIDTDPEDTLRIAKWFVSELGVTKEQLKKITERDRKDYFIQKKGLQKLINERLTAKERKKLDDNNQYKRIIERITAEEISNLSKKDLEIVAYKRAMESGYNYSAQRVKTRLTTEEVSKISENLSELPGIDIMVDSNRTYPLGESTLFGSIKQIPKDKLEYYMSMNYDRSEQVGVSGLELQYENVLRGIKEKSVYLTHPKTGETIGEPRAIPGQRGKDIVLSIDMELQVRLEKILEEEILRAKPLPGNDLLDSAYIVMMNPKTGEIKGIAGKKYKDGKFDNDSYGALYNSYEMGSTVKGATVLAGLDSQVIHMNEYIHDAPFKIGNITKSSWTNMGTINDLTALERSSNVYMFNIMQRLIGREHWTETYDEIRYYYNQFGLGVQTGIDFPNESIGYQGTPKEGEVGTLYDIGIGQFDTYTTIQMVQYISTIANGGFRVRPQLVKEIREPSLSQHEDGGRLLKKHEPEILNILEISETDIKRVQQGLWMVMHGSRGTAKGYFDETEKYRNPAGKTGTAQRRVLDPKSARVVEKHNLTLVGYAPFDNPEIAFAIVVPDGTPVNGNQRINKYIGQRALESYWELQNKYSQEPNDSEKMQEDKF